MSTATIERRSNLSRDIFQNEYLARNRPIIVTDAITRWRSLHVWTSEYFTENFGDLSVQVYDDLFTLVDVTTLRSYFDDYWLVSPSDGKPVPYVRWYSKFKDVDFVWADDVFEKLAPYWSSPYFLPDSNYLLPAQSFSQVLTPVADPFPAKGIFISAAGARTRLHKDPWGSDSILCQVVGKKRIVMYAPGREKVLTRGNDVIDIEHPQMTKFVDFESIQPEIDDVLLPGEVLLVPAGWYHHANALTNGIAVTWNCVHVSTWPRFFKYLVADKPIKDLEVLRYFASLAQ